MVSEDWMDRVRDKIVNDPFDGVTITRILFYLDEVGEGAPAWRTLKASLGNDKVFESYCKRLAEDTKTAEKDPKYKKFMGNLYELMMRPTDDPLPEDAHQRFQMVLFSDSLIRSVNIGVLKGLSKLPPEALPQVIQMMTECTRNTWVDTYVRTAGSAVSKYGTKAVTVGLCAVYIAYDTLRSIYRWWIGEISGKRCVKLIIDSCVAVGAGVGGGTVGAIVGSLAGPVGGIIGGVVGAVAATMTAQCLVDRLTQCIFDLPKEEALENAYRFLDVNHRASNQDVNDAYHKAALKYHPDKGGTQDDFCMLQMHMATIKMARGEVYL